MAKTTLVRKLGRWGARRLLARLHRVTHRMPIELRQIEPGRVLVVAPHMDDEVIGPGGTLLLHKQTGSQLSVVFVSDSAGDPSQTGISSETTRRKLEAQTAAEYVGFELVRFLDYADGKLSLRESRIAYDLAILLDEWQPTTIFCPFPTDHHRDHQATSAALATAIGRADWHGDVWGYEVWSTLWPNAAIDISEVVEKKRAAISCHASQVANMAYVEAALGLNRYRGLRVGVPFAEAFYVCGEADFIELTEELLLRV
jgi:LmbE family N-acetylglucosaminyl deacetylase